MIYSMKLDKKSFFDSLVNGPPMNRICLPVTVTFSSESENFKTRISFTETCPFEDWKSFLNNLKNNQDSFLIFHESNGVVSLNYKENGKLDFCVSKYATGESITSIGKYRAVIMLEMFIQEVDEIFSARSLFN